MKNIFMFDVESTSLHGTAFAVGVVVINTIGKEIDKFELLSKEGAPKACDWVKENVIPNLTDIPTCDTDRELRDSFFAFYLKHKDTSEIWSDVNFPVETNFLAAVANDNINEREFLMPYPLRDVSTIVDVSIDRGGNHNPLDDSRASAKCLLNFKYPKQRPWDFGHSMY